MINRKLAGKRGSLIHSPVGSGKTKIVMMYIKYLIEHNLMADYCVYTLPPSALESISQEIEYFGIPHQVLDMNKGGRKNKIQTLMPGVINIVLHDQLRKLKNTLKETAPNMLFIVDEFHLTLNETLRTSITLETVRLSENFVGLSGTIIKDNHPEELIEWLSLIVDYQVNVDNYWSAIGALISRKYITKITVEREDVDVKMTDEESNNYYSLVPSQLGGTASKINFKEAVRVCYQIITQCIINYIKSYVEAGEKIFCVAKDINHQIEIKNLLEKADITKVFLISKDNSINYEYNDDRDIECIITTKTHSTGYSLSKMRVMIQGVYFGNQATRDQLEGRLNRGNSPYSEIKILTLHTGILSYIHEKYEDTRNLAKAIKSFAKEIGIEEDCVNMQL
jgi:superfamily II DNA or RNA helicase